MKSEFEITLDRYCSKHKTIWQWAEDGPSRNGFIKIARVRVVDGDGAYWVGIIARGFDPKSELKDYQSQIARVITQEISRVAAERDWAIRRWRTNKAA